MLLRNKEFLMERSAFPFMVTGFSPHIIGCVPDLSRPPLLCSIFLRAWFIISNCINEFRSLPHELALHEKLISDEVLWGKASGVMDSGDTWHYHRLRRALGSFSQAFVNTRGQRDGKGERFAIMFSTVKVHFTATLAPLCGLHYLSPQRTLRGGRSSLHLPRGPKHCQRPRWEGRRKMRNKSPQKIKSLRQPCSLQH